MFGRDRYKLNFSNEFDLKNLEEFYQTIELDEAETEFSGSVTGTVVDGDGNPVDNATVKIFDVDFNPIKHTMTNATGEFIIPNVDAGEYLCYAVKDGYLLSDKINVNVGTTERPVGNLVIEEDTTFENANIYGITFDDAEGNIMSNVRISLRTGSASGTVLTETLSASDGEYLFMNIPAGTYFLTASAEDYILGEAIQVRITAGTHYQQQLYLTKLNDEKEGTINGVILDRLTKKPISNAFVGLYEIHPEDGHEVLINTTRTNIDGRYFFGKVVEGKYVVKAKSK